MGPPGGGRNDISERFAAKLSHAPYVGSFSIVDGPNGIRDITAPEGRN